MQLRRNLAIFLSYSLKSKKIHVASNYGCHQWSEHELSGILDRGETKEDVCRSLTSSVNKLWLGGPAQALRLDRDVPVIGCQDCDCCKPGLINLYYKEGEKSS